MFKTDLKDIDNKTIDKMLRAASRLKKISAEEFSGWADFVLILEGYANSLLDNKRNFNLSMASDEEIERLRLYDRDVWLINNFIKVIPLTFVNNIEKEIAAKKEEDEFTKMMKE